MREAQRTDTTNKYVGIRLGIEDEGKRARGMRVGTGVDFQFQILKHPNSWHSNLPIPIPNTNPEYLHSNGVQCLQLSYYTRGTFCFV